MPLPRVPEIDEPALHVHSAAGKAGPVSRRQLHEQVTAGQLGGTVNVWMKGMEGWEPLATHRDALFTDLLTDLSTDPFTDQVGAAAPTSATPAAQPAAEVAPATPRTDDEQDAVFVGLVKESWKYLGEHRFAAHIDEVFLGGLITSTLDTGYSLIDLSSDGSHHYVRFENLADQSRIVVRLTHLTGSLALSKVVGQRASAVIGYGERVGNITKIWGAIQAEMKSSYIQDPEPGTITVDGDVNSGYVYCQVDLYLSIDDYVSRDYAIDYSKLTVHVGSVVHALRKYLRGRFA